MTYSLTITPNAFLDIQDAIDWENSRDINLGSRFFQSLESRFADILLMPRIGSIRYDNVRCTATKRFQYLIHYTVDDLKGQIIIVRVLHISRKPIW